MKKNDKIQAIAIVVYLVLCVALLILIPIFKNVYLILAFGVVIILGYFLIHLHHSINYYYVCPKCKHEFKINVFEDIFASNGGKLGKKVTCPACGEKTYMKDETK